MDLVIIVTMTQYSDLSTFNIFKYDNFMKYIYDFIINIFHNRNLITTISECKFIFFYVDFKINFLFIINVIIIFIIFILFYFII